MGLWFWDNINYLRQGNEITYMLKMIDDLVDTVYE